MAFIDPKPQICHMCHDMRRRLSRSNDIHALGAVLLHALAQVLALADIDAAFALAHRCAVFFGSSAKIVFASQVNTIIQLAHKSNPANREPRQSYKQPSAKKRLPSAWTTLTPVQPLASRIKK
jgi:hypothetical protein